MFKQIFCGRWVHADILHFRSDERERLLPTITYETYRFLLIALQLKAGISIPLTAHVGRHTFATLITLENEVPIESIAKMMGHASIASTQIYAQITDSKISRYMDRLIEKCENESK